MKINIKATGIELTQAIADYASKKISAIEKYLDRNNVDTVAQVEVGKITSHHKSGAVFHAEVHLTGGSLNLYAVSETGDLYAAVDIVKDEIVHNIIQSKGKRQTLTRRGAELMKSLMKGVTNSFKKKS